MFNRQVLKNLLLGAGTLLSVLPATSTSLPKLYRPAESDVAALRGDWEQIGGDFQRALEREQNEQQEQTSNQV